MKFTKRAMVHSKETRESQKEFGDEIRFFLFHRFFSSMGCDIYPSKGSFGRDKTVPNICFLENMNTMFLIQLSKIYNLRV